MHLFEAMIACFDATHDLSFQNRAGEFFALFLANLYDKQKRALGEYFEEDWSKIEPVSVEPGHQAEWVWLLKGFERITGCPTGQRRAELLATALRYRDEATGCLSTRATTPATSAAARAGCGRRPRSRRRGSRRPSPARRARRTRRARRWCGSNGIISAIP